MSVQLNPLPPFDPNAELGASVAARWKLWLRDFDTFLVASGIRDAKRQKALLLYQAGPKVREIFNQLSDVDGEGDEDNFATTKAKLIEYFEPQKNRRYEVYRFRETRQGNQESLDTFHTRLRQISSTCEFEDVDFEIEEQIIIGGRSSRIRRRALRDPTYTLKDMLIDGRRDETSSYQARDIETTHVHTETTHRLQSKSDKKTCNNCGGEWPHKNQCPAQGKTCRKCNKPNHFQSVCWSSKFSKQKQRRPAHSRKTNAAVGPLQHEDNSSVEEYLYTVSNDNDKSSKRSPVVNVVVEGHKFNMILDTGSTINVIDRNTFEKMEGVKLQQKRDKLTTRFSKTPYKVINRKGTQITAEDSNHRRVTRNVSFFKKIINNYQKRAQMLDSEDVNQSNRATYACEQEVPRPAERLVRKRFAPVRYGEPIPMDSM